jgi:TolB-like protein/DNA-binding SARP family transcriptional activator/Flp pilus assembly protein TadD
MSFYLRLLGGASIEGPDGPLTGRGAQRHRLALLAMLATSSRGGITRDKLIAFLWPDSDEERARRSLSDSVYRINSAVGDGTVFAVGEELRLDADRLPSDVSRFTDAVQQEQWERAIDAWGGPFLDGFQLSTGAEFEHWVDLERDRLARQYAEALEALAAEQADAGDLSGAAGLWSRRAAHDPYDSRVALRLMEALEAAGNRAGALQHARIHAHLLRDTFGTDPDPAVAALEERLRTRPAAEKPEQPRESTQPEAVSDRPRDVGGDATPPPFPRERLRPAAVSRPRARAVIASTVALIVAVTAWFAWGQRGESDPAGIPAIAVLPFETMASDEESLFFADGVTEDVATNLARIGGLRVIGRASVVAYRDSERPVEEIAGELGVDYLLRGSIRRAGDAVRITAQLIDARTRASVWAESYDRQLEDIFAVQSDIARRVAAALEAELTPNVAAEIDRRPTRDLVAYNLYLHGRFFWHRRTEEDLRQSVRLFEEAVGRDPGYARAWAGLADAYAVLAFYDYLAPDEGYPKAKRAARRALDLDNSLAEAHASLGYITLYYDWDAQTAEREFRRAIDLNPSYSVAHQWYANLLVATGRFEEAEREMGLAREVNPLSLIANLALGWVYYYAGRYEEAVRQCDLALEMDPDWDLAYLWRGMALEELGREAEAIASLTRAVALSGGSGITVAALAHAHAGAGEAEQARELVRGLTDAMEDGHYRPSFEIAQVHVALGEREEALRWLEQAYQERSHSMVFLEVDPKLAGIARQPRFRRLVEQVGLTR